MFISETTSFHYFSPEQSTSGTSGTRRTTSGKRHHEYEPQPELEQDDDSVIEVTEDDQVVTQSIITPPRKLQTPLGWSSRQPTRYHRPDGRHYRTNRGHFRPNMRYQNHRHNNRFGGQNSNRMQHPNKSKIPYGLHPATTPCKWERLPQGCRNTNCQYQHSQEDPNKSTKFYNYLRSLGPPKDQ